MASVNSPFFPISPHCGVSQVPIFPHSPFRGMGKWGWGHVGKKFREKMLKVVSHLSAPFGGADHDRL